MSVRGPVAVVCLAATAGLVFASVSTLDFVAHLDRQVHDLHCSFVPGVVSTSEGSEGCKVTLMSPYSSLFRSAMWGGLPISLPAMAVFAFVLFRGVDLWTRPSGRGAGVLLGATVVPVVASLVMGWIAFTELDAACKLCIGIYISSAIAFFAAIWARMAAPPDDEAEEGAPSAGMTWLVGAVQLGGFVLLPTVAYMAMAPNFEEYIGSCGRLDDVDDPYGVLVPLGDGGGTPAVEVLDPLCPACKAFEERLDASGLPQRLDRRALLFPLDQTCNWMVSTSLHPGACAISEAVLCAHRKGVDPNAVIDWAFEHQEAILAAEKSTPGSAASRVRDRFEGLADCLGSAEVQSDLNKSLRWAVAHELPVMTPQLYIGGVKLCDEDTDLGMEWAVTQVLARQDKGALPRLSPSKTPKAPPEPEPPPPTTRKPKAKPQPKPKPKAKPKPKPEPKPEAKSKLPSVTDEP